MRSLIILFALLFVPACSSVPDVVTDGESLVPIEQHYRVWLFNHGWHTGIVVPAEHIGRLVPALVGRFPNAAYIEFGWGEEDFYQAPEITSGLLLQALLWPTDTVIHAVGIKVEPEHYFVRSRLHQIRLQGQHYSNLVRFIAGSFAFDQNRQPLALRKGLYGDSEFYQAQGSYYLTNTCNVWTAKALRSAGFELYPVFYVTAGSVSKVASGYQQASQP